MTRSFGSTERQPVWALVLVIIAAFMAACIAPAFAGGGNVISSNGTLGRPQVVFQPQNGTEVQGIWSLRFSGYPVQIMATGSYRPDPYASTNFARFRFSNGWGRESSVIVRCPSLDAIGHIYSIVSTYNGGGLFTAYAVGVYGTARTKNGMTWTAEKPYTARYSLTTADDTVYGIGTNTIQRLDGDRWTPVKMPEFFNIFKASISPVTGKMFLTGSENSSEGVMTYILEDGSDGYVIAGATGAQQIVFSEVSPGLVYQLSGETVSVSLDDANTFPITLNIPSASAIKCSQHGSTVISDYYGGVWVVGDWLGSLATVNIPKSLGWPNAYYYITSATVDDGSVYAVINDYLNGKSSVVQIPIQY